MEKTNASTPAIQIGTARIFCFLITARLRSTRLEYPACEIDSRRIFSGDSQPRQNNRVHVSQNQKWAAAGRVTARHCRLGPLDLLPAIQSAEIQCRLASAHWGDCS